MIEAAAPAAEVVVVVVAAAAVVVVVVSARVQSAILLQTVHLPRRAHEGKI